METNFINSITAKLNEIKPDFPHVGYEAFLNTRFISRKDYDYNCLTKYQTAFLILLNEQRDNLFFAIHKQIDLFFDSHLAWNGVSWNGIELPEDGTSKWAMLWQLSASLSDGPMFHICFDGWQIENSYVLEEEKQ